MADETARAGLLTGAFLVGLKFLDSAFKRFRTEALEETAARTADRQLGAQIREELRKDLEAARERIAELEYENDALREDLSLERRTMTDKPKPIRIPPSEPESEKEKALKEKTDRVARRRNERDRRKAEEGEPKP